MNLVMETQRYGLITVASLLLLGGELSLLAQERPPEKPRPRLERPRFSGPQDQARPEHRRGAPPSGLTFSLLTGEMHFGGRVVKGAPYSATVVTEMIQTLSDGTRITGKTTAAVYRDSEGRTRHEQTFSAIGPFAAAGEAPQLIFINDPVAGVQYVLDPRNRTARRVPLRRGPPPMAQQRLAQARTESLGRQMIEGVEAEGTRSTLTIPEGRIGNDRPIEIVSERWYSPELQVVVLSRHHDPRLGDHLYRLTNINRSEPPSSLFQVPTDYTIREGTFSRGSERRWERRPKDN